RVEILPVRPSVYTHIPAYDREPRDQTRQWVVVPRGNRFATWIRVNRTDTAGEMKLAFHGLPAGVTATCDPVAAGVDRVPVVFEAAADAPVAGALADVVASSGDVKGGFLQQVNLIYGQPNNTVYYATTVQRLATAVAEAAPFSIRIVEPKVPLVQGGAMNLRVVAERREGFTKPIVLRMLWAPPGVGAANEVAIPEGQSEADYPLNADAKAAVQSWRIAVLGTADAGGGPVWVSTPLTPLRIDTPYVGAKIDLTAVPQGGSGTVTCKLEVLKPFEGKAKVALRGLPPGVTATPAEREVTKDDKDVEFAVAVEAKSPAGVHKSLFCQILVPEAGDHMTHAAAGGSALRIDPPPKNAPAAAAKPGEKPAETKKLSRLEQLRAEAEKKEPK
ncbi:MAG TPA: peptidase, partial [Planctomycetota bacterium]|nr:peptidase [Planctomycetota bacterium]